MERLWTPWRMAFVGGPEQAGCLFCRIRAEDRDEENLVLHRGEHALVMLNLYPYNSGHLMVAPYEHTGDLASLPADIGAEILALTQRSVSALTEEYGPHGYNVGMNLGRVAGAGVPDHLHVHVVPRWNGDTNFMPVLADVRVMPEHLDATWQRLRAAWVESAT